MLDEKAAVRDFWDAASCGEVYAEGLTLADQFQAHSRARYALEPYIHSFAGFDGAEKDVLEIGVGMGADHVEWARSRPARLTGIDLTPRAVDWTTKRMTGAGFTPDVLVGDGERLPFPDDSFDLVYSWGVLHCSPDTATAFQEVLRVLRPGGEARIMIYQRPSWVGLMLWVQYGLLAGRPFTGMRDLYAHHLESPGTKGYTVSEAHELVRGFRDADIRRRVNFADLLEGKVGQRHDSRALRSARRFWPRPVIRRINRFGLMLLIRAHK